MEAAGMVFSAVSEALNVEVDGCEGRWTMGVVLGFVAWVPFARSAYESVLKELDGCVDTMHTGRSIGRVLSEDLRRASGASAKYGIGLHGG